MMLLAVQDPTRVMPTDEREFFRAVRQSLEEGPGQGELIVGVIFLVIIAAMLVALVRIIRRNTPGPLAAPPNYLRLAGEQLRLSSEELSTVETLTGLAELSHPLAALLSPGNLRSALERVPDAQREDLRPATDDLCRKLFGGPLPPGSTSRP